MSLFIRPYNEEGFLRILNRFVSCLENKNDNFNKDWWMAIIPFLLLSSNNTHNSNESEV